MPKKMAGVLREILPVMEKMTASPKPPNDNGQAALLNDVDLKAKLRMGQLVIDPILRPETQIQGGKVDLRLDNVFMRLQAEKSTSYDPVATVNPGNYPNYHESVIDYKGTYVLHPGTFVLGQTFEFVQIPNDCFGWIEGRSSLARRGILVHITASGIDPGFIGKICLELFNVGPVAVELSPLIRICALSIDEFRSNAEKPYQNQSEKRHGTDIRSVDYSKGDQDAKEIKFCVSQL